MMPSSEGEYYQFFTPEFINFIGAFSTKLMENLNWIYPKIKIRLN
jgi:hypothetical protein